MAGSRRIDKPWLVWLPNRLRSGCPKPAFTTLTEGALAAAVARRIDDIQEGRWTLNDTIGYACTASANEIDFTPVTVPTPAGMATTTPIESKWVGTGWRSEARVMEAKNSTGIIATKGILDLEHPTWAVPAPLRALLLG